MRTTQPPVVDGLSSATAGRLVGRSASTTATIQASYAIVPDFFNGLLAPAQRYSRALGLLGVVS
jgi:hypothetical protein